MRGLIVRNGFFVTALAACRTATILRITLILGVIVLTAFAPAAASTIVFNNFGPGDSYAYCGDFFGRFEGCDPENPLAGDFIPSSNGKFNEVWTAMWHQFGLNEVTLTLPVKGNGTGTATCTVGWQSCDDHVCTPPQTREFTLRIE